MSIWGRRVDALFTREKSPSAVDYDQAWRTFYQVAIVVAVVALLLWIGVQMDHANNAG